MLHDEPGTRIPRVLIVEDDITVSSRLIMTLEAGGYLADAVPTVAEAADAFERSAYDVAVLDFHLPDGTGEALLTAWRTRRPDCIYVITTSHLGPVYAADWMERGATAYLHKPFNPADLVSLCDRVRRERAVLRVEDRLERRTRELHDSEERYRLLLESIPESVYVLDRAWRHTLVNAAAERFTGLPRDRLLGAKLTEIFPGVDSTPFFAAFRRVMDNRCPEVVTDEYCFPDGRKGWYEVAVYPAPEGILCISRDISERKRSEAALRALAEGGASSDEDIFRLLVRELAVALGVRYALLARVDGPDHNTAQTLAVWSCGGYADNFSYALAGTPCRNVVERQTCFYPDGIQSLFPQDRLLAQMNAASYWGAPLRAGAGDVLGILAILDDRPMEERPGTLALLQSFAARAAAEMERRRAEEAVRDSKERYRRLAEDMPVLISTFLPDGTLTYVNAPLAALTGQPAEALLGRSFFDLLPADEAATVRRRLQSLSPEAPIEAHEQRHVSPDGAEHHYQWTNRAFFDAGGRIVRCQAIGQDITGRKRSERALAEREEYLRTILRTTADGFWTLDAELRLTDVNDAYCRMSGYTRDELLQLGVGDLNAVEQPVDRAARRQRIMETGSETFETRHRRKDGSVFDVEVSVTPMDVDGGKYVCFCRDISRRKQAELEIRASARRAAAERAAITEITLNEHVVAGDLDRALGHIVRVLSAALGVARASIWRFSESYSEAQCLALFEADTGTLSRGTVVDTQAFPRYFDALRVDTRIDAEDAVTDPRTSELADSYLRPLNITSVLDAGIVSEGQLTGVVCLEHTGTRRSWRPDEVAFANTVASIVAQVLAAVERKRAETALRESEERFRLLVKNSSDVLVIVDRDGIQHYISPAVERITGYTPEELIGKSITEVIHPDDMESVWQVWDAGIAEPAEVHSVEYRHIHKTEGWVYLEAVGQSFLAEPAVRGVVVSVRDVSERKRTDEELRLKSLVLDQIKDHVTITDLQGVITYVNHAQTEMLLRPTEAIVGHTTALYGEDAGRGATQQEIVARTLLDGVWRGEVVNHAGDGSERIMDCRTQVIHDLAGKPVAMCGIATDITEHRRAEQEREALNAQLSQAQKMESVGRLAGGVAHDFNNMLTAILGYAELALDEVDPATTLHHRLVEIRQAAQRSADLTRQLLAFARRQTVTPRVLDLDEAVEGMLKLLRRLIGEDIDLVWKPGRVLWPVRIDPSQVDQVLANLTVNARDAIAGVGTVTVQTANVTFDAEDCADRVGCVPGEYVMLTVSDTGCGMDRETVAHVFEPFFTTKGVGHGTGLGLATVYGIVKQNEGFIDVTSAPGEGSTFAIYLPRHGGETPAGPAVGVSAIARGGETVLLVEDEPAILDMSRIMLQHLGYTVLAAAKPAEALRLAATHDGAIDLLITDVVMPEMNGRALAAEITTIKPGLRCLFMSGYTADVIGRQGVVDKDVHFMQKPFSVQALAEKVRAALAR